jgi:RNA polymerase sigma-70 factor (ECF subfamily)
VSESFYQEFIRHDPARNPAAHMSGKTISMGVETPTRTRVFADPHPADQPICTQALQYIIDLIEKHKVQRDAHDFDEFYLGNFRFVRNVVNARAQDWTLAEEVTDEAMAIAHRKWDELREHPNPVGFTVVTARRILSRTQRQQASKNPPVQPLSLEATPGLELKAADGDTASTAVNRIALEQALRVLTADQRECLVLHEILDHPVREVAGLLNLPESTVKTRLRAARQSLRHLLNDDSGEEGTK